MTKTTHERKHLVRGLPVVSAAQSVILMTGSKGGTQAGVVLEKYLRTTGGDTYTYTPHIHTHT